MWPLSRSFPYYNKLSCGVAPYWPVSRSIYFMMNYALSTPEELHIQQEPLGEHTAFQMI